MALSISGKHQIKVSVDEWETKRHADCQGEKVEELRLVPVMLIAWDGPVAHCEALNWVYLLDLVAGIRE
jgi:hypothetical protein